jgi:hypothetical protein
VLGGACSEMGRNARMWIVLICLKVVGKLWCLCVVKDRIPTVICWSGASGWVCGV